MSYSDFVAECERIAKNNPQGLSCAAPGQPSVRVFSLPFGIDYREALLNGGVKETVAMRLRAMAAQIEEG